MTKYTTDRVPYPPEVRNDLCPELLGFNSLSPFAAYNSSPRASMFAKHIGQLLVVDKPEVRYIQTGIEREFAKNTFKIKFDHNSYILKTVQKFPLTFGKHSVNGNPMTTVIYENNDHPKLELDVLHINNYHCMHHYFGFDYKFNKRAMEKVRAGERIPAGTIIADSPNVTPDGDYAYGINANVCLVSHPGGTEDGVVISESFAKKLKVRVYETREFSFGDNIIPLNLYGDDKNYKPFPEFGDVVRPDGVVCATRDFIPELAPSDMSVKALQQVTIFDKCQYATPGAKVIDITVMRGSKRYNEVLSGMDEQVNKYYERNMEYYREIIATYEKQRKIHGEHVHISREYHRLLVEGMALLDDTITLNRKRKQLPPWTVTITMSYDVPASNGFKITDTHGGKSVGVSIRPDHEMPRDEMGNVADLMVDDKSTIKRLIKGKLHEHYIGACRRDTTTRIREWASKYNGKIPDDVYEEIWDYLLGFYKIVSPPFYDKIGEIKPDIKQHVDEVIRDGIYIWLPPENPVSYMDVAVLLEKYYPACNGKVEFVDFNGNKQVSANNIIIGQIYYVLLEKIANNYSAVSSAKLQHFGQPSKPSGAFKYAESIKVSPVRFGESEYRLFVATAGGYNTAEIADRSLNIDVHEEILKNILLADKPTNTYSLIDRKAFPIGKGFLQRVIKHEFETLGLKIVRTGDEHERRKDA